MSDRHAVSIGEVRSKVPPFSKRFLTFCGGCGWCFSSSDYADVLGMAKFHAERAGAVTP